MGIVHPKYKVAVVQAAPAWLDLDASIAKTIALIEEAAAKGAKLIRIPRSLYSRLSLAHLDGLAGLGDRARICAALFRQFAFLRQPGGRTATARS